MSQDLFSLLLQHPNVVSQPNSRGEALAVCPWHADTRESPNLGINVTKRVVKCFSCGQGGARRLAKAWGIELPPREATAAAPREPFMTAEQAMQYLAEAYGLQPHTIGHFGIEAAPNQPSPPNKQGQRSRGAWKYPTHAGLRYKAFDRSSKPKYFWHSRTNTDKLRAEFYNARSIPPGVTTVYLVNGEPSVWVCWQAEVWAVCAFGEGNVTEAQLQHLMTRGVKELRLIPDLDQAGTANAYRTLKLARSVGLTATARKLPDYLGEKADVADLFIWCRKDVQAFRQALDALPVWEPPNPDPLSETRYYVQGGRIWMTQTTKEGDVDVALTNFVAYATEEVTVDDGVEQVRSVLMEGELDTGRPLPPVRIPLTELLSLNWIPREWSFDPVIRAGASSKESVREVIQRLSVGRSIARRTVYTHTGWRHIDGHWVYLMPTGKEANGSAQVELPDAYNRYSLPLVAEDPKGAVKASMRLLFVAAERVTIPLLVYTYLAPLTPFVSPSFALWLRARTGSFKSTMTALSMSHYGQFDYNSPPAAWDSTARGLERYLFDLKDALCWIDDFAPKVTPAEIRELQQKAEQVLRAFGNRSTRMRMTRDVRVQRSFPPRGLLISTAELYPTGESVLARFFPVDYRREDVDLAELGFAQEEADRYPHAMRAYIDWIARSYDRFAVELVEQYRELRREKWLDGSHPRTRDAIAVLMVGAHVLSRFAVEAGAWEENRAKAFRQDAQRVFQQIGEEHSQRVGDQDPVHRFLSVLDTLQTQRHVWFLPRGSDSQPPVGAELLGWYDAQFVYLDPVAAYNRVARWLREEGRAIGLSEEALRHALQETGYVALTEPGRTTVQMRMNGRKHRVMVLHRDRLPFGEHFPGEIPAPVGRLT